MTTHSASRLGNHPARAVTDDSWLRDKLPITKGSLSRSHEPSARRLRDCQSENARSESISAPAEVWSQFSVTETIFVKSTPLKADSGMRTVFWTILGTARSGGPTKPGGKNSAAEELLTSWVDEFPSPSVKTTDRSCGPAFLGSSKFTTARNWIAA